MTTVAAMFSAGKIGPVLAACGLVGLALAVGLRVVVAGADGVHSVPGGLVFGAALLLLTATLGFRRPQLTFSQLAWGVGGAAVLCLPPLLHRLGGDGVLMPPGAWPTWAAMVTLVAIAEEVFLRGALYDVIAAWRSHYTAIGVCAAAFALLHVPLYGWWIVPLDLAVGVFLGALRWVSGSVVAPATTHVLANLAGWWLR